ncbi:CCR4-NOT transcription complex subunit 6 [Apiospora rasikravindrae]|uniref:CCR4-NOT transcription complex subunit 6 n=1 Tax=Apiospora rasikravindrae TaxID=990691 RepID=A0ABR1RMU9_9PEZI
MADEPTLPPLPSVSWDSESQSFTRKRVRGAHAAPPLFSNSSDPAVFSSDDDPNVENYAQGGRQRKKRYVGSWFHQHPASGDSAFGEEVRPRPLTKRTLQRQFDSGVWMGSDISTDMEEVGMEIGQTATPKLPQLNVSRPVIVPSPAEKEAHARIIEALDLGRENLDLTSLGLERLSDAVISFLGELSCIPLVTDGVPFEHKDPALKIFLSGNPLIRAPGALFNLEFLSVLSLRNTRMAELPPAIGNLRNLKTLNISLTRLRYLPAELLDLMTYEGKLKELIVHPNPFHQPDQRQDYEALSPILSEEPEDVFLLHETDGSGAYDGKSIRAWLDRGDMLKGDEEHPRPASLPLDVWQMLLAARSPIQYTDSRGVRVSQFTLPRLPMEDDVPPLVVETEDFASLPGLPRAARESNMTAAAFSRVPSLMEIALRSCSRTAQREQLPGYLEGSDPHHLADTLHDLNTQADANGNSGTVPCSTCRKSVVKPLAQWIEWWDLGTVALREKAPIGSANGSELDKKQSVPFMKRACSWGCLPKPVGYGTGFPGSVKFSTVSKSEN